MARHIGILTSGGDTPGLNATIRGISKAAMGTHGMTVIGFRDGFKGLMQNRYIPLDRAAVSGILTLGGTILGTSREKPHKMNVGGKRLDMTDAILENIEAHHLDALICLGGGGTQKNALHLHQQGAPVITLPKTIDKDVWGTDTTFGFDTALGIATEAIDRLHSTAHSHHRIIVVELMGHNAGWLALGAGLAGGADVVLVPEIPYDVEAIAATIKRRRAAGSMFSIVAVSEGAVSADDHAAMTAAKARVDASKDDERKQAKQHHAALKAGQGNSTARLSRRLEELTGLETRVTILGHVQRGGTPSAQDRLLATHLGTASTDMIAKGIRGVMVAMVNGEATPVPLEDVAGKRATVPLDHPWIKTARSLGVGLGD
ncbi:MAG: ATP-dependent 6-phosphofructokinase [Actinomycetia bacterium]|nr:ATP-dependent 6-phosphofructokinase [Actinomycetes bacterium]MCP4958038.1 ATP-dependent 6-phosphofructokinase [Actinomycetes bacterium]